MEDTSGSAQSTMIDEIYESYRRDLITGRQAAIQDYDKAIIAVTTVLLGLTLTLSNRTGHHPPSWLLLTSWVLLLLNLLCTVVSLILGYYSFNSQLDNLERNRSLAIDQWAWDNQLARITERLNFASVACFILGVAALILATYLGIR